MPKKSSKSSYGKVRRNSFSKRIFGKKGSPLSFLIFWTSVVVVSYLAFRTYHQNVDTFKFLEKPKKSLSSPPVKRTIPAPKAIVYYPDQQLPPSPNSLETPRVVQASFDSMSAVPNNYPFPPAVIRQGLHKKRWPVSHRVWTQKPKIAFVIDDIGHKKKNEELYRLLGDRVTYAILPHLKFSTYFSRLSKETGAQVILHQPMQSEIGKNPGSGLIHIDMSDEDILATLSNNLLDVPDHIGINNHMGSLGTQNWRVMEIILKELQRRGMFFLDSHTTPNFVSRKIAKSMRFPVLVRDVFLDNIDEPSAIRAQMNDLRTIARKRGYGIAIGHDRANTLQVILEEIPKLEKEGFQIVLISEMVDHELGTF